MDAPVTARQESRPQCPECQAPLRDIEVAHIDAQRTLASSDADPFNHQRLLLFCGHRVEVVVEAGFVRLRPIAKP